MAQSAVTKEGALSRELADFLVEFSIALHKNAIYPRGHPLLDSAVVSVTLRLQTLLRERGMISLGVARHQLVIEGVATDPNHPLLRELAQRLHRHHLGAVRFTDGVTQDEVADTLVTLGMDASRMEKPLGLGPVEALNKWEHVRFFALTFEQLELMEEDDATPSTGGGTRAAQLWVGLARAALQVESGGADSSGTLSEESPHNDPVVVAKAIDEHQRDVAYDQVIVGYLLQIAEELKAKSGHEAIALQKRISRLVGSLKPDTLRRLLSMGGDANQRRKFVLDASEGLAVDAVVELVQAAADTSDQTISHSLVRLLNKLAVHAEKGNDRVRPVADAALRDNVKRLIGRWSLDDPNPDAYRKVLEGMSKAAPSLPGELGDRECEPERLVQMSLETGAFGPTVSRALDALVSDGKFSFLIDAVQPFEGNPGASDVRAYVITPDVFRLILQREPLDLDLARRMFIELGMGGVQPLFDALEAAPASDDRIPRAIVDMLASLGSDAGAATVERLPSAPPAVLRRLLGLIGRLGIWPPGFSPADYAGHADERVRREAIALMFTREELRERGVRLALVDADERIVRLGLGAVTADVAGIAVPLVLRKLREGQFPPELRVLAIRVMADSKSRAALDYFLQHAVKKRRFLGMRLAPKSLELVAMLNGLAAHWPDEPNVQAVLALAAKNADAEIRQAVAPAKVS